MNFDEQARNWDTDKRINRAKVIAAEIGKAVGTEHNNLTAMEFGCGTGLISFNLCDRFSSVTLIDSSHGMTDILNEKLQKNNIANMSVKCLDLTSEETIDETFDVIYTSMVLHHIKDTAAIIKRFHDLLNDNGYLCIVDLDKDDGSFHKREIGFDGHNGFDQQELKSILAVSGFEGIESKTFYYDEKIVDGQNVNYSLFLITARSYNK